MPDIYQTCAGTVKEELDAKCAKCKNNIIVIECVKICLKIKICNF